MDIKQIKCVSAIVFDFDGTMFHLFKNYNLKNTVKMLNTEMKKYRINFREDLDAFDVFSEIEKQSDVLKEDSKTVLKIADNILTCAEEEAVKSGEPVLGVSEIIRKLVIRKVPVGIATNNSEKSVKCFLNDYCSSVQLPIVGRIAGSPQLMKPNIWSLTKISKMLKCRCQEILFVGDTKRDYECARAAGCYFLGMASTKIKEDRLLRISSSDYIVHDFYEFYNFLEKYNIDFFTKSNKCNKSKI